MVRGKCKSHVEIQDDTTLVINDGVKDRQVKHILIEFEYIFISSNGFPLERSISHGIDLESGASLPNSRLYHRSMMENEEIKRKNEELLQKGYIMPSASPCGSPFLLVTNKDGSWSMCINYHAINKIIVKNCYPLPRINDLLGQL